MFLRPSFICTLQHCYNLANEMCTSESSIPVYRMLNWSKTFRAMAIFTFFRKALESFTLTNSNEVAMFVPPRFIAASTNVAVTFQLTSVYTKLAFNVCRMKIGAILF